MDGRRVHDPLVAWGATRAGSGAGVEGAAVGEDALTASDGLLDQLCHRKIPINLAGITDTVICQTVLIHSVYTCLPLAAAFSVFQGDNATQNLRYRRIF